MRITRWGGITVAGATLAAMSVLPLAAAHAAAQTLTVQVGGDSQVGGVVFEGMRFLAPPNMTVHKGDTITFNFAGFHTATLLPAGVSAADWRQDHTGLGGDYSLIQQDSDDTNTFMLNNKDVFPSDGTCGTASSPCSYDGNSVVNSGLPINSSSFSVTVDTQPNTSFWVLCLLHGDMQTRISVVDNGTTTTTQDQINSYASSTLAADHQQAAAEIPALQHPTSHKASGHRVWNAFAGFDGGGWGLDAMFPHSLHITRGDTVTWHFGQLMGNIHTVTFPKAQAVAYSNNDFAGSNAHCEGANGGPDTGPTAAPPQFCSSGPQDLELEIHGAALLPTTAKTYSGTGYRSSGVRGPDGLSTAPFSLTFTKASPKNGFTYACAIHGAMMSGAIFVKNS